MEISNFQKAILFILFLFVLDSYAQDRNDSIKVKTIESNIIREFQKKNYNLNIDQDIRSDLYYKSINASKAEERGLTVYSLIQSTIESQKLLSPSAIIGSEAEKTIFPGKTEDGEKRLFGPSQYDSRIELLKLKNEEWEQKILQNAESTGMLVEREKLTQISKDFYELDYFF